MNMSGLSFDGLPPINIPMRFFASAIFFIVGLALFVLFTGEDLWLSRWHPSMLALTHGFTLGFITPVMMGALLQMLPVVGGIGVKNVSRVGRFCHPLHFIGTLFLMWGFISTSTFQPTIKLLAVGCLALSFTYYVFAIVRVLWQYFSQLSSKNPTIIAISFSIFALLITIVLGIGLQGQNLGWPLLQTVNTDKLLTNTHALWGGIGWMSLLILGVSLQVIPMFHVAPSFSKLPARYIPITLIFTLIIMSIFSRVFELSLSVLLILFLLFNLFLLKTIGLRKRKIPDVTINYWRFAAVSLIMLVGLYFCPDKLLPEEVLAKKSLLLSSMFVYFYLISVIQGMLLKILPFLSYTHLQQRCLINFEAMKYLPNMHELMNKKMTAALFYCHVFTGSSLILTILNPEVYWTFGSLLLIEFLLFSVMFIGTCRVYYRSSLKIKSHVIS